MINSGNFPGNSARYYGLQTVPSSPVSGPASEPIIANGTEGPGSYFWKSTASFSISSPQSLRVAVEPGVFGTLDLPIGWIVDMRGGDQVARSLTVIELIAQNNKTIQFVSGETDKTFRVGQVVDIVLNVDASKNMKAVVKSFVQATGTMIVDIIATNGTGSYPQPSTAQQWRITVDPSAVSGDYMLARVANFETPVSPGDPYYLTFDSYQAYGSGTYAKWTIAPQWNRAYNFVRNLNYSAYDASIGPGPTTNPSARFDPYVGQTTSVNVVTSDTDFLQSGYTQITSKGLTTVYEDEYDINRPYVGKAITRKFKMQTVTDTTTITYDSFLNPTPVTTIVTTESPISATHTFTESDFVYNDSPGVKYFAGNPAVYSNGVLVSAPTPSVYINDQQSDGSIEYKSTQYERIFQEFTFGDPPEVFILPVFLQTIGKAIIESEQDTKPSPDWFYYQP